MTLFPTCVLPGCEQESADQGVPCSGCLQDLGPYLAPVPGKPLTVEQVVERDTAMVTAQRVANGAPPPRKGPERKAMQQCWICDERRTCTRQPVGWECDSCLEIR